MTELAEHFVDKARRYLSDVYLPKIERCLDALTDEDVWWRPNEESNSVGNLLLHLDGSTRMWIISGVGGAPDRRDREQEFGERTARPRAELIERLKATIAEADSVMAGVDAAQLLEPRRVRDRDVTALEAILHTVEHFSMHAGQIFMLTKMRKGQDLKLYH